MTLLSGDQRRLLLRVARDAVAAKVRGVGPPKLVEQVDARPSGAFVTLRIGESLRGCVGQVDVTDSLVDLVCQVAAAAATEDPRFSPVGTDELAAIVVEVSVLGPLEACSGPEDLEIGLHGLVAEAGARRGLLLPQVAVEQGWDPHLFVANTCTKAGLRSDAWKGRATLFRFEAEVFSEDDEGLPDSPRP